MPEDRTQDDVVRTILTRDERLAEIAARYIPPAELRAIRKHVIGSGWIGGKAAGMLVARAVIAQSDPLCAARLEPHESYSLATGVFHSWLSCNDCRIEDIHRDPDKVRHAVIEGKFPDFFLDDIRTMLDSLGPSPIILRSSSTLEDAFGTPLSGLYESVFCLHETHRTRMESFLAALRSVYAGMVRPEATAYRTQRGLRDADEQMAVLVQRVSGTARGRFFYPQAAGVALSANPYVWSPYIDRDAGVLRLVFGLGTRAVRRSGTDYTRIVALNAPRRRPETGIEEALQYGQHKVDVLDLKEGRLRTVALGKLLAACPEQPMDLFATVDRKHGRIRHTLTFDGLLSQTSFVEILRRILHLLEKAYDHPVQIEITVNLRLDGTPEIALLQCRPIQIREGGSAVPLPTELPPEQILFDTKGPIVGRSSFTAIDRVIYVVPAAYAKLPLSERPSIARLIGRLTRTDRNPRRTVLLLGPGRWGTSSPTFGVPVRFPEIERISVLCEVIPPEEPFAPEVSLGTHFFNDLVEADIVYLAITPRYGDSHFNESILTHRGNILPRLLPEESRWSDVVQVLDFSNEPGRERLYVNSHSHEQRAVAYLQR